MQVKLWTPCGTGMVSDEEGEYILYTDAVKMQREAFVEGAFWQQGGDPAGPYDISHMQAEATRRYKEE